MNFPTSLVAGLFVSLIAIGGCELIATADRDRLQSTGPGGAGTGGDGGSSCVASECPGNDTDCEKRGCADDACAMVAEPSGASCTEAGNADAKVCDGVGSCVECVTRDDCAGTELCVDLLCVPENCINGSLDGDESDVDCGGSCTPCDNGKICGALTDCASGFCDNGTCAACSPGDCDTTQYCDAGTCTDKLVDGDVCTAAVQCASGFCPAQDGVCCDTACDSTCEACLTAKNGGAGNGTCAVVPADTDPDTECPLDNTLCQAAGCSGATSCNSAADSVVCRPGSGDDCDPDETCSSGTCPADVVRADTFVCRPGSGDTCDPDEECTGVPGETCPADVVDDGSGAPCRAKNGSCDVAEFCTGTPTETCPTEGFAANHTAGSPACSGDLLCDSLSRDCPADCLEDLDCGSGNCNESSGNCM